MAKEYVCKKCKDWHEDLNFRDIGDWGKCYSSEVCKEVFPTEISNGIEFVRTFEGFGCRYFDRKVFVKM